MFAFTSDVSNGADTDRVARLARTMLANFLGKRTPGSAPMTDAAGEPARRSDITVPNLSAATGYMAWRG